MEQIVRLDYHAQTVRQGRVIKESHDVRFAVSTLGPQEADPQRLLQLARGHWGIENGQHHRRDRTQDEDRCTVRDPNTARTLSLFRSLAIFLLERQKPLPDGKKSLPDFERQVHRNPWPLLRRFT